LLAVEVGNDELYKANGHDYLVPGKSSLRSMASEWITVAECNRLVTAEGVAATL
jgi:hypothetical protein